MEDPDELRLDIMKGNKKYVQNVEETSPVQSLRNCYFDIITILSYYMDMDLPQEKLISLWTLGTWFHKQFNNYPFLFINAMRGAGKTRLQNLIAHLVWNGKFINNITEAVLFRTAKNHTLVIDEIESILKKDKSALRELLNSAYKKGASVERVKKVYSKEGDEMKIEQFDLYAPVVMGNIAGMDEVLGDRCIPIILEKSGNLSKIKLMELFDSVEFINIKRTIREHLVYLVSVLSLQETLKEWNLYVSSKYTTTYTTLYTLTTQDTQLPIISEKNVELFKKIDDTEIDGRNLELFFPLILLARMLGEDILEDVLKIAKAHTHQKIKFEQEDSPDIAIYKFISQKEHLNWYNVKDLTQEFKMFYSSDEGDRDWLTNHWVGKALRRLKLVVQSRRLSSGIQFLLDITKAQEKSKLFDSKLEIPLKPTQSVQDDEK